MADRRKKTGRSTIEERCQQLARELHLISRGQLETIDETKIESLVTSMMDDLAARPSDYRWEAYTRFISAIMEQCLGLNPKDIVIIDDSGCTEFMYTGRNETGFKGCYFRTKTISSMISQKLVGVYLVGGEDMPPEIKSRKGKGVRDSFAFRMVVNDKSVPSADFIRMHDEGSADEESGIEAVMEFIDENRDYFELFGLTEERCREISASGFSALFSSLLEAYRENIEPEHERRLHDIADSMQALFPTPQVELVNIGELNLTYQGERHEMWKATGITQKLIMPDAPQMSISNDIIVFNDHPAAEQFSANMKRIVKARMGSRTGMSYRSLDEEKPRSVAKAVWIQDRETKAQWVLCHMADNPRVFLGFRGSLDNPNFCGEILGYRSSSVNKTSLIDAMLDARTLDVERAFPLRLTAVEVPLPYFIHPSTKPWPFVELYGLTSSGAENRPYKDYIKFPLQRYDSNGDPMGLYKAIHFLFRMNDPELNEDIEFQMRTSYQHFQAERGSVSHNAYEDQKRMRNDPRQNPDILKCAGKKGRRMACAFFDRIDQIIINEYNRRITGHMKQLEGLFFDRTMPFDMKLTGLTEIINDVFMDYSMLMNESISRGKEPITAKIGNIPYILMGLLGDDVNADDTMFLKRVCEKLNSNGFDAPKDAAYLSKYPHMRSLTDRFISYVQQRSRDMQQKKGENADTLVLQTLAIMLHDYLAEAPASHTEAQQNLERFRKIMGEGGIFIKPGIRVTGGTPPKNTLPFIPAGSKPAYSKRQIGKAYGIITDILSSCGLESDMKNAEKAMYHFIREMDPSRKKNYFYIMPAGPAGPTGPTGSGIS